MKEAWMLWLLMAALSAQSQAPQKWLVRYATAHLGNGEAIANAVVAWQGDELILVADGSKVRVNELDYDTVINADGWHIYPGFMVMDSRLGLTEIEQVNATNDYSELGELNSMVRALPAFNTESVILPTVMTNGVLLAQIAPSAGAVCGRSAVVKLMAPHWQQAAVRADEGIYLNWPQRQRNTGWWGEPGKPAANKKYAEQCDQLYRFFNEAKAYAAHEHIEATVLHFEAMRALWGQKSRLYVRVDRARDVLDAIQFTRAMGLKKVTLVGAAEAQNLPNEVSENQLTVVLNRAHRLPDFEYQPSFHPAGEAAAWNQMGVEMAFSTAGDMEAMITRNLPFEAGTAVHHGLPYEQAVKALTLGPARLTGIDQRYGSLEAGKSATLFLSTGDALDMATNNVVLAVIDGEPVPLTNRQTELYERYKKQ